MRTRLWWLLVVVAGCDTPAKPSDPASATVRLEDRSRELESCAASAQCANGLRCFDQTCRRVDRSVIGDFSAALGARARKQGDYAASVAAYSDALKQYGAENLATPVDLECAYGSVLSLIRNDKEKNEVAATVLHRCVLGAPAGSSQRQQALADLAELYDEGLDPAHLARPTPADVYLSRAPAAPGADKLTVAVSADPPPTGKSFAEVTTKVMEPAMKAPLVACWEKYYADTKKVVLAAQVAVKSRYQESDYDDEDGRYVVSIEGNAPSPSTPEGAAAACVRTAVSTAITELKTVKDSFKTTLTIRVQ